MSAKRRRRALDRKRFSIGASLVTIISLILIISLGSITALVLWQMRSGLKVTAEENNFEINRSTAMTAETALLNARSVSRTFIQTITAPGAQNNLTRGATEFFFSENQDIAAVLFIVPGRQEQLLVNSRFFSERNLKEDLAEAFINNQREAFERALRGETVIRNAAPYFSSPVLALFFPWQTGGAGGVIFSSKELSGSFGSGINQSYLLNREGDILVHSDFNYVRRGTNISNQNFARSILGSAQRSGQQVLETDFSITRSAQGYANSGFLSPVWNKVNAVITSFSNVSKAILKDAGFIANNAGTEEKKPRQLIAYTKINSVGAVVVTSAEYGKVFETASATIRINICLAVFAILISIILIKAFSRTISIPLKSLANAAKKVQSGDFNQNIRSNRRDEVGNLANSFGKMCDGLQTFGQYTNREIALRAMHGEIKPGGSLKQGTIFFSDIRGLAAKMENFNKFYGYEAPEKIVLWLNEYFSQAAECVEKTDGIVDKFIGGTVMAHWGAAFSSGSPRKDAFNCVKSSLMMRKVLYFMNRGRKTANPANPPVHIGCGISSGIVAAGLIGGGKRMEYSVLGEPVNLALQIEALTKLLGVDILISEDTWKLIGDKFLTDEMPPLTIDGKSKPVRIFAVVNFAGDTKGPQSLDEVRSLLGIAPPEIDELDAEADSLQSVN